MSAVTGTRTSPEPPAGWAGRARWAVSDGVVAALRILLKLRHDPAGLVLTVAAPVAMVLIFGYVFGSAIQVPGGGDYREYLVPGLLTTTAFNVLPSMIQMARDTTRGVVDRFRSMPVARVAVPLGQAVATSAYGVVSFAFMAVCGLIVGWRAHRGLGLALAALGLLVAFQFAMTWVGMWLGLVIGKEETAAQASILVFPVTMISNVFVPTDGMPAWLRTIADLNPVSAVAAAVRELCGNPTSPANGAWQLEHPVTASVVWCCALLAVFVPLTTVRYARIAR
jgi:ABC-2 type transport system permease protein